MPKSIKQIKSLDAGVNSNAHPTNIKDDEAVDICKADITKFGTIRKIADEVQNTDLFNQLSTDHTFDIEAGLGLRLLYSDISLNKLANGSFKTYGDVNYITLAGYDADFEVAHEVTSTAMKINDVDAVLVGGTFTTENASGTQNFMGGYINEFKDTHRRISTTRQRWDSDA